MNLIRRKISAILKHLKQLIPHPPPPSNTGYCVHCGRPFERSGLPDGEPIIECRHHADYTEYIHRFTPTRRTKIIRQKGAGVYTITMLEFCEFCFLMKPRFAGLKLEPPSIIRYVWQNERGEYYEHYEYGV